MNIFDLKEGMEFKDGEVKILFISQMLKIQIELQSAMI